jgi:2-phospho-L-lactate guanylyltransferase
MHLTFDKTITYKALIPVKALATAKSRLAEHLTLCQRQTLVLDMLHHVLQVLRESEQFESIAVVSPDMRVLELAQTWSAQALIEEQHGHNPSLHAAALKEKTSTALLTISADLPLLSICDIHSLIEQSRQHQVVLAASHEGTGTNAILVRPPLAVPYLFGPNSLQRYQQAARQRQLSTTLVHSRGLATDIDTIEDLHKLRHCGFQEEIELATCDFKGVR